MPDFLSLLQTWKIFCDLQFEYLTLRKLSLLLKIKIALGEFKIISLKDRPYRGGKRMVMFCTLGSKCGRNIRNCWVILPSHVGIKRMCNNFIKQKSISTAIGFQVNGYTFRGSNSAFLFLPLKASDNQYMILVFKIIVVHAFKSRHDSVKIPSRF